MQSTTLLMEILHSQSTTVLKARAAIALEGEAVFDKRGQHTQAQVCANLWSCINEVLCSRLVWTTDGEEQHNEWGGEKISLNKWCETPGCLSPNAVQYIGKNYDDSAPRMFGFKSCSRHANENAVMMGLTWCAPKAGWGRAYRILMKQRAVLVQEDAQRRAGARESVRVQARLNQAVQL